jgi:hypothetical protein
MERASLYYEIEEREADRWWDRVFDHPRRCGGVRPDTPADLHDVMTGKAGTLTEQENPIRGVLIAPKASDLSGET